MDEARPIVIRADQGAVAPGTSTPGMERRQIIDDANTWVGWVQADAGLAGGWHHHGERDSYIYVLSGGVRIEYGPAGREHVSAVAGDFIFNPARMVHREIAAPESRPRSSSCASAAARRTSTWRGLTPADRA